MTTPDPLTQALKEHTMTDDINDGIGTYDVAILLEHELTEADAAQVHGLHDEIADQVVYHVLVPLEDAAARIEAAMGSLATGEALASPAMALNDVDLEAVRTECEERSKEALTNSCAHLRARGATAQGQVVAGSVIDALAEKVKEVDARETIVVTSPHVVAEFFHVDWTSQARRKLGVPVLHLLEHENFDEQAGGGEGVSGL